MPRKGWPTPAPRPPWRRRRPACRGPRTTARACNAAACDAPPPPGRRDDPRAITGSTPSHIRLHVRITAAHGNETPVLDRADTRGPPRSARLPGVADVRPASRRWSDQGVLHPFAVSAAIRCSLGREVQDSCPPPGCSFSGHLLHRKRWKRMRHESMPPAGHGPHQADPSKSLIKPGGGNARRRQLHAEAHHPSSRYNCCRRPCRRSAPERSGVLCSAGYLRRSFEPIATRLLRAAVGPDRRRSPHLP